MGEEIFLQVAPDAAGAAWPSSHTCVNDMQWLIHSSEKPYNFHAIIAQ